MYVLIQFISMFIILKSRMYRFIGKQVFVIFDSNYKKYLVLEFRKTMIDKLLQREKREYSFYDVMSLL